MICEDKSQHIKVKDERSHIQTCVAMKVVASLLVAILALQVAVAKPRKQFLPSTYNHNKIAHGQPASPGDYPYYAHVTVDATYYCGGVIVNEWHVLTFGDCAYSHLHFTIILGATRLDGAEPWVEYRTASYPIVHPSHYPGSYMDNIAILRVDSMIYTNMYVKPAVLQSVYNPIPGNIAHVAGFGVTSAGSTVGSQSLLWQDMHVVEIYECERAYGLPFNTYNQLICARAFTYAEGDICAGDMGGPLVDQTNYYLWGLAGYYHPAGCGLGQPSLFVSTVAHYSWITQYTKSADAGTSSDKQTL